jgi:hypothetical protein
MGYIALSLTVATSILALRFWLRVLTQRVRRMKEPVELGNQEGGRSGAVLVGRPDPFRTFVNGASLGLLILIFGLPHLLAIAQFWRSPALGPWHFVHYGWSLIYWLTLMVIPAFVSARELEARRRRVARPPDA